MYKNQKNKGASLTILIVVFISFLLGSCEVIEGIFKTGMGVGIILAIIVIAVIIGIISKLGKK